MVVNLSVGALLDRPVETALDEAVEAVIGTGVTVVVAAGNAGVDAQYVTPAHVEGAITVGAYDVYNSFAPFSNHGALVDILAPGVDVLSMGVAEDGTTARALSSGTSMAAAHVSGAAALFLSQYPNASPQQVREAIVASGRALIHSVPSGTTDKTLYVGPEGLAQQQVPPFFQYAVTSGSSIWLGPNADVKASNGSLQNASVFANGQISLYGGTGGVVEGFGYYGKRTRVTSNLEGAFQPRYNPTGLSHVQKQEPIAVPAFTPGDYQHLATRTTQGNLALSGHYELGTRENPMIWYVSGQVYTNGPVTFSGYGIFVVETHVTFNHGVTAGVDPGESTLGIYAGGQVSIYGQGTEISAQILADDAINFGSTTSTIRGSLTSSGHITLNAVELEYRPASPVLTEPFWPSDGGTSTAGSTEPSTDGSSSTTECTARGKNKC